MEVGAMFSLSVVPSLIIFTGLTRGDMIAEAIIGATNELDIRVPMVVRLQGTNSEDGLKLVSLLSQNKIGQNT